LFSVKLTAIEICSSPGICPAMIVAAVRVSPPSAQQEALDAWLAGHAGGPRLVVAENAFGALAAPDDVPVVRLAAGCVCCIGQVALRVALVRAVRAHRPSAVLLLLASADHLPRVRALLDAGSLGVRFLME
jgi:hypothetical protein